MESVMNKILVLGSILAAQIAVSDVYVSPYKGDGSVRYGKNPNQAEAPRVQSGAASPGASTEGTQDYNGQIARRELGSSADASVGEGVPVNAAMEMLFPGDEWTVNIDKELDGEPISWSVTGRQPDVIQSMAKQNGLYIAVNDDDKAVGVSADPKLAPLLAYTVPKVWWVEPGRTMSQQINQWGELAGWRTTWEPARDFDIEFPAVVTGEFVDAVNQLLASVADSELPLQAQRASNNVLVIVRGGWDAP